MTRRLHVLAIGGSHHFAHFLPVALEMTRRKSAEVTIFVLTQTAAQSIADFAKNLELPLPKVTVMSLPQGLERFLPPKLDKIARLICWAYATRQCDAILCAERTSTILKRLPGRCPPLIHIPHGAGDRAVGFESRFRYFDMIMVSGTKDQHRLLAEGLATPETCIVTGPIKITATLKAHRRDQNLFANDRPILLYNPHFSPSLTSGPQFVHRLANAVHNSGRYNLIIAPHMRMAENWSQTEREHWESLAAIDQIIVDLGSSRSADMTYTLCADAYIGDVSSQVYEFLVQPRPCLFIDAHQAAWRGNEDYAMWQFGEVVPADCDILEAIERAFSQHKTFRTIQCTRARAALDGLDWLPSGEPYFPGRDPSEVGADNVEAFMMRKKLA